MQLFIVSNLLTFAYEGFKGPSHPLCYTLYGDGRKLGCEREGLAILCSIFWHNLELSICANTILFLLLSCTSSILLFIHSRLSRSSEPHYDVTACRDYLKNELRADIRNGTFSMCMCPIEDIPGPTDSFSLVLEILNVAHRRTIGFEFLEIFTG